MKRKFTFFLLCGMIAVGALAQRPSVVIKKASVDPVIDGVVDDVWAEAEAENNIDVPTVDAEGNPVSPTLGTSGETTWQGLWTYDGIYILLRVTDDDFYPHYLVPGAYSWEYDKPELYFDVNYILEDAGGPSTGMGHYQVAPEFKDGLIDGTLLTCDFNGTAGSIIEYAEMVDDPNYIVEYFVPFSSLLDQDGIGVDITGEIGFDVTIIDRDEGDGGNRPAVWSNNSAVGSSWVNMDDCGIITFDGAETGTYIEDITLTGGEITENNGTLQIGVTILPEDASNQNLTWSVVNGTGKASVNKDGVVRGILDGDVTIVGSSTDGSFAEGSVVVTISNQIVSMSEVNVIRNPYFDQTNGTAAAEWGGWGGDAGTPMPTVVDGVAVCTPIEAAEVWQYSFSQSGLTALPNIPYVFSFVAWADETRTFQVDFEDTQANNYNRYGASGHEWSSGGRADWTFDITDEPTRYTFDVVFDQMVETTVQLVTFQLGLSGVQVYLDSIILVSEDDLGRITDYLPVEAILVSSEDNVTRVEVGGTLQMSAEVFPAEADYPAVKWSVINGTGEATIDGDGLLTGVTLGSVTVVASAVDDSNQSGEKTVNVSWPTGITQNSVSSIQIYPNPAMNELNVVLNRENSTVAIYNSVGMMMDQAVVSGTEYIFDISSYAAGLYFVRTDNAVSKFIK
ncbi:MAG: Ig-like domain-containing protein [Bacteroidales bacterium]